MNRIVETICGEERRVSWLARLSPDGVWHAVACVDDPERPFFAAWRGDRAPDSSDIVEAVRRRILERSGNGGDSCCVEEDMERTQTMIAIQALDSLFRKVAHAYDDVRAEYDPYDERDPDGSRRIAHAMEALERAAESIAKAMNDISYGSQRDLRHLLGLVGHPKWPGLKALFKEEATEVVECKDGWAVSWDDGDPFWLSKEDLFEAARDWLAVRILESEGWPPTHPLDPDAPAMPEVSDVQARDWALDGLAPAGVEL